MLSRPKKANGTETTAVVTKDVRFDSAIQWLQLGIDLEARRIEINFEVSDVMASMIIRAILKMNDISHDPIELHLSSFGGSAYDGLAIYDAIRTSPSPVYVIANGKIMSAAFIIFLAGQVRAALPHTTFMMHSVSFGSEGKVKDQEIDVQEAKRLNNVFLDILQERTKRNKKWWYRNIVSHDKFFNVQDAVEAGVVNATFSSPSKKVSKKKTSKKTTKKVSKKKATKKARRR